MSRHIQEIEGKTLFLKIPPPSVKARWMVDCNDSRSGTFYFSLLCKQIKNIINLYKLDRWTTRLF